MSPFFLEDIRTLIISVLFWVAWIVLRRKGKRRLAAAVALALAAIATTDLAVLPILRGMRLSQPLVVLVPLIYYLIYASVVFLVFRRYHPSTEGAPDYADAAALQSAVSNILDSGSFRTALRSTLPQGKEDQQFGLDYVPYMLHSVDERRKRAVRSSRFFLLATVGAALVFSTVVMYFGYILVNEAAAGSARSLAGLRDTNGKVLDAVQLIVPNYYKNPRFQQEVAPSLEKLAEIDSGKKNKEIQEKIRGALDQAKNTGDFVALSATLAQAQAAVSRGESAEQNYATAVADGTDRLTKFVSAQSSVVPELTDRAKELEGLIPKAEDALSKPEYRTSEIIKRLALGLVVSTFFLALLRYLGNLYRIRYLQVIEAERDDYTIRRFYVAFKSSIASDTQRAAVLTAFMAPLSGVGGSEARESSDDTTKQGFEVIKELVQALSKKL